MAPIKFASHQPAQTNQIKESDPDLFGVRTEDAKKMTDIVIDNVFNNLSHDLVITPFGYETRINYEVRELLRFVMNETACHIKYAPDYVLVDKTHPEKVYLLEFKCTRTPLYSQNRINILRNEAKDLSLDETKIGQMEAAAYDNYQILTKAGVKVAVLDYCPYSSKVLLSDYFDKIKPIHSDIVRTPTARGSRTPFINFDLRSLRTLAEFLCQEHPSLIRNDVDKHIAEALLILGRELPPLHGEPVRDL